MKLQEIQDKSKDQLDTIKKIKIFITQEKKLSNYTVIMLK